MKVIAAAVAIIMLFSNVFLMLLDYCYFNLRPTNKKQNITKE
jgi:hypothetical protein